MRSLLVSTFTSLLLCCSACRAAEGAEGAVGRGRQGEGTGGAGEPAAARLRGVQRAAGGEVPQRLRDRVPGRARAGLRRRRARVLRADQRGAVQPRRGALRGGRRGRRLLDGHQPRVGHAGLDGGALTPRALRLRGAAAGQGALRRLHRQAAPGAAAVHAPARLARALRRPGAHRRGLVRHSLAADC